MAPAESPNQRAQNLLRMVVGDARYSELRMTGSIQVQSKLFPGRVYHINNEAGVAFNHPVYGSWVTLCLQPQKKDCPVADVIAAKYLMLSFDEAEATREGNVLPPSLWCMMRALYREWYRHGNAVSAACQVIAFLVVCFGSFALMIVLAQQWGKVHWGWVIAGEVLLLLPGLLGLILLLILVADIFYLLKWTCLQVRNVRAKLVR